jgi:hypothetical protein
MSDDTTPDFAFTTMQTLAKTIGTQMLTIKLHERAGSMDLADTLRKQNAQLEEQLDKTIDLYFKMKELNQ